MVVRRKGGGGIGGGAGDDFTACGLAPPAPSPLSPPPRVAQNRTHDDEVQRDFHPTQHRLRPPRRRPQLTKRSSSAGRIRRRSEMSTTAISYASDDELAFDDLSSCGTVSETGRPRLVPAKADGTCSSSSGSATQQQRVSVLDTSYSTNESDDEDDGNDGYYSNANRGGHGKRSRVSFYTAIYDTSRGESRAEGTGVRVQRGGRVGNCGDSSHPPSPPVSQVSIPTADAQTIASSHGSDEHSRSPQSRIRDMVRRISRNSLSFFGDDDDGIGVIDGVDGDDLFSNSGYDAMCHLSGSHLSGSKSVERPSKTRRPPKVPSSPHRIENNIGDHDDGSVADSESYRHHHQQQLSQSQQTEIQHTPLGLVRIVPARESSLRCILTRGGSGGGGGGGGASARCSSEYPSSVVGKIRSSSPANSSFRSPSLLVTMGCILLVVSALIATSDMSWPLLSTLLGAHQLSPSALASTYLSLAINEVRYQAFRVASVQCRDLNAIRYDWIGAGDMLRNRRLLDLEEKEGVVVGDDYDRAVLTVIEKLRREASFVSRQRVEERFGKGPHYVRFHVELGDEEGDDSATTEFFVAKMAEVSLMPISISSFLGQVDHGFWNGRKFDINAGHILLASGESIDANDEDVTNLAHLTDLGIASPIYGEYNPLRRHGELTLGFVANRPKPHFYINLQDNEDVHGLHSDQDHHFADGEADPSFADIVYGKDVVKRMVTQVPFFGVDGSRPMKTVKIVRAEIDLDYTPSSLR